MSRRQVGGHTLPGLLPRICGAGKVSLRRVWIEFVCVTLAALLPLLAGCTRPDGVERLDARPLRAYFPAARLAFGSDEASEWLGAGWWGTPEHDGTRSFRWATGLESEIRVALPSDAIALVFTFAGTPNAAAPSRLEVTLEDRVLGEIQLPGGWTRAQLPLPRPVPTGLRRLKIRPLSPLAPVAGDPRPLSFQAESLEVLAANLPAPAASPELKTRNESTLPLRIPGGGTIAIPLRPSPDAWLETRARLTSGHSAMLEIDWESASGTGILGRWPLHGQLSSQRIVISVPTAGAGRLRLTCAGASDVAVELDTPTLYDTGSDRNRTRNARSVESELSAAQSAERPRNLIIYLLDALRADELGTYGAESPNSPVMDRLARQGRIFQQFLGHSAWTRPSVATLFTGLYPWSHKAQLRESILAPEVVTIAERLHDAGFFTGAVIGNANLALPFGYSQGFVKYIEPEPMAALLERHPDTPKPRSDDVNREAEKLLDAASGSPFFLFLHSVDPHFPYVSPIPVKAFEDSSTVDPREVPRRRYRAALRYNDEQIGVLLDSLQRRGLLDSTLLVFLADHGEEFWDHGGLRHGHTLNEEITRIPLILFGPGVKPGIEPVAFPMADLAPSLLASLGHLQRGEAAERLIDGKIASLDTDLPDGPREIAGQELLDGRNLAYLADGRWKLIQIGRRFRLFDLHADPGELRDVAADQPFEVEFLRAELLLALRSDHPMPSTSVRQGALDPAIEQQLKALGYVAN